MQDGLQKNFFSVSVKETSLSRQLILSQSWSKNVDGLRSADVVLLPWHEWDNEVSPNYPQGSVDFLKFLRRTGIGDVCFPVTDEDYKEIALHGKAWRLPTLLLSSVVLPILINVISDQIGELIPNAKPSDSVSVEIIIERPSKSYVSFKYEGSVERLAETLEAEGGMFIEEDTK